MVDLWSWFHREPEEAGRLIEIISREGQPRGEERVTEALIGGMKRVSSSWISEIGYDLENSSAKMTTYYHTKTGTRFRTYDFPNFDPKTFVDWHFALSKGRFYHQRVKGAGYAGGLIKRFFVKRKQKKLRESEPTERFREFEEMPEWSESWEKMGNLFEDQRKERREKMFEGRTRQTTF